MTYKQRMFVAYYVGEAQGNATEAARMAGYKDCEGSGRRLLHEPEVHAAIAETTKAAGVEADAVLKRLAQQAFADPAAVLECLTAETVLQAGPDGQPVRIETGRRVLDLDRVRQEGLGPLIRRVTPNKHGDAVEMVDSQRALELLGRYLSLWNDRLTIDSTVDVTKLSDDQLRALAAGKPADALSLGLLG